MADNTVDLAEQFFIQCDTVSKGCDGGNLDTPTYLGLSKGIPYES